MVTVSTADPVTDNYRLIITITNYTYEMISPIIGGTHAGAYVMISIPLGLTS